MRIIGGRLGGRRLPAGVPKGARPTSDRVREAIASVLQSRGAFEDADVLDLFAGSGALGLEALSRGARSLVALDRGPAALAAIRKNALGLGVQDAVVCQRVDLLVRPQSVADRIAQLGRAPFTLVFVDPPYAEADKSGPLIDALAAASVLAESAHVVIEHAGNTTPAPPALLAAGGEYRYGDTAVSLYERGT